MESAKRITVLGNFSGRNAGDNAILGNLLDDISSSHPDVEFIVPTLNPRFVRTAFGQHRVRALGLMPWNGALKIFGLPTVRAMLSADLVLVTDNILFDRSFFNPAFNYLSTISLIAPLCKRRNIPVVLYNASLGPINTERGRRALQRVLDAGPVGILRDTSSPQLVRDLGLRGPEFVAGADCALNTRPPADDRIESLMAQLFQRPRRRPVIGLNVNAYIDSWQGRTGDTSRFTSIVAEAVNQITADFKVDVLLFVTQVMDHRITRELRDKLRQNKNIPVASNPQVSFQEIAGLLSRMDLLIAMRTHAQILAASVATPFVNINSYPKSRAFLDTIGMGDWSLDVAEVTVERLIELVHRAWLARDSSRAQLLTEVRRERDKARAAVHVIGRYLADATPPS